MSIVIETFIICDGNGDTCRGNYGVDNRHRSGKEHREEMKFDGWKTIGNKDYCPACVANPDVKKSK